MKIVFFGTPDFAIPALKSLINFDYHIEAVVTQPEKPVGRAKVILPSPVKKVALEYDIKVFEPHSLKKDEEFFKQFKHLNSDICLIAAYGKIIPSQYIELPKYGFINIHPSLLPKYRGPSPIQTAILNGDTKTGVTIMKIDEEVDHGSILSSKSYYLPPNTYYSQAEQELARLGAELLIETIPKYLNEEIKPREQDHSQATFTKIITREDGKIDWNKSAEEIYNQIRALNPEPGTWTIWQNKILNIIKTDYLDVQLPRNLEVEHPGTVFKLNNDIAVVTQKCYLILKQIQLEGGKEMDAKAFLNGHPDFLNSTLE
ncbi:MAG: methionyl-tRNA formyltransferase [Candidatus Yanofskybacteria bacterium RIFCSPHIGHO2_02_FULL_38_22b]|uniref:Methionyl-tRNA formyltransferase n=1 Tax=Candidatus Yanofskybacteria bacterium RIFCSPHIGHO2_02_FULL_38_22b TaxID=1802673 RepID=A0A1F8F4A0_9BACT|nr:MAG: methionyl-tRNA formyltransferase [Candidatus Yanofskybacteria bacterium RIFCSPHIGHO2_02_FULL_38_22b]OGN20429.1 MAG: methionyl-tRNA formyltransferase [Candidatus Yanofskybacteria bacterium RIFCSPLOWO2_01_FULL_39_28]